jgi:hypothetical protein
MKFPDWRGARETPRRSHLAGAILIAASLLVIVTVPAADGQFVSGDVVVDAIGLQDGGPLHNDAIDYVLRFGCPQCGEGIGSRRTEGVNRFGLDFYTKYVSRLSILSDGNVGIGTSTPSEPLEVNGDARIDGSLKFELSDPADPSAHLAYSPVLSADPSLLFRGEGRLTNGEASISLPAGFERLTSADSRTVILTNIDGFDPIAIKTRNGAVIANNAFSVYSSNPSSSQRFSWEVKGVRVEAPVASTTQ